MKISEVFPTTYVTAADLKGRNNRLTIKSVTLEEMRVGGGKMVKKPVVWFMTASKGFVLNATNARVIAKLYGDDTEQWVGKQIVMYPTQVKFGREMVDAIRVKDVIPAQSSADVQPSVPVEEPPEIDDRDDYTDHPFEDDEEIPFH